MSLRLRRVLLIMIVNKVQLTNDAITLGLLGDRVMYGESMGKTSGAVINALVKERIALVHPRMCLITKLDVTGCISENIVLHLGN